MKVFKNIIITPSSLFIKYKYEEYFLNNDKKTKLLLNNVR